MRKNTLWKKWMLGASLLALVGMLQGCASGETDTSCVQRLDEKNFASVSEDTSCANYERASAYLGRAGFLFANFLKDGASDNFRTALGIDSTVTTWSTWEGKTYYENALQLSGSESGDEYEGLTRSSAEIEIHYFTSLANILAETYISLDSDGNGAVSDAETASFTNIRSTSDASYGKNDITATNKLQVVYNGTPYLVDTSTGLCDTDSTYAGTGTPSSSLLTCFGATATVSGTCSIIGQVSDVQNMFSTEISSSNNVLSITESFVAAINRLDVDLAALKLPADSDLRKALDDFTTSLDNGGTCTNDTTTEVNQLLNLISVSASAAQTSYETKNLVAKDVLVSSSDNAVDPPTSFSSGGFTFSCTGDVNVRLIFQTSTSGTYVPYYDGAASGIKTTFASLANIQKDSTGATKASTKGDNLVSFSELLCMQ